MDGFTAGLLLSALKEGANADEVADLHKSLKNPKDGPPSREVVELVTSWIHKQCKIKYTDYVGCVLRVNEASGGFYPGSRYPVVVKILSEGEAKGQVFEYELDQIEIIE